MNFYNKDILHGMLKKFVIDNGILPEDTLNNMEIGILLNKENFRKDQLKSYFKWLLLNHLFYTKKTFIKETKSLLSDEDKKVLKNVEYNPGSVKSVDEYFQQLYSLVKNKLLNKDEIILGEIRKNKNEHSNIMNNIINEDYLKELMMIYDYPIYINHLVFLKDLMIKNYNNEYSKIMNSLKFIDKYEIEFNLWSSVVLEIKKTGFDKTSNYLKKMLALNVISKSMYDDMNQDYKFLSILSTSTKKKEFRYQFLQLLKNKIANKHNNFLKIFDMEERAKEFEFVYDDENDAEIKQMLLKLTGYDKNGHKVERPKSVKMRENIFLRKHEIRLLVLSANNGLTERVTHKDFFEFFRYLHKFGDIIKLWEGINKDIPGIKLPSRRGKPKRKTNDIKSKIKNEIFSNLMRYYNNFIQTQISIVQMPFLTFLLGIIQDREFISSIPINEYQVKKMIHSNRFIYRSRENRDIVVSLTDHIDLMLINLLNEKDNSFKIFMLDNLLKFITSYKLSIDLKDYEEYEPTYMEIFLNENLTFEGKSIQKLNMLVKYISSLKRFDLNNSQQEKLKKIEKVNNDILKEVFDSFPTSSYDKLKKLIIESEFSNNEKKIIKKYSKDFYDLLLAYKKEVNDIIADKTKIISKLSKHDFHISQLSGESNLDNIVFDFLYDDQDDIYKKKKELDYHTKILNKYNHLGKEGYSEFIKIFVKIYGKEKKKKTPTPIKKEKDSSPILKMNFDEILKGMNELYKQPIKNIIMDKKIEKKVSDKKNEHLWKTPELDLQYEFDQIQNYRKNMMEKENPDIYMGMKRNGENIFNIMMEHKIINKKKRDEMNNLLDNLLIHQKAFLDKIHLKIKLFLLKNKDMSGSFSMFDNQINYEYMLIVCILLLIIKGIDITKLLNIKMIDNTDDIDLMGFDLKNKDFVKIVKVDSEKVVVEKDDKKYSLKIAEVVVGKYFRVRVIGKNIYKGQVATLVDINKLSEDKIEKLREDYNVVIQKLLYLKKNGLINKYKSRYDFLVYQKHKMTNKLSNVFDNKYEEATILLYEGDKHEKRVKINLHNIKIIDIRKNNKLKIKKSVKKIVIKDFGDNVLSYIFKTFNTITTHDSDSFGLAYFRLLYLRSIKQINEYFKSVNSDYIIKKGLEKEIKAGKKRLEKSKSKKSKMEYKKLINNTERKKRQYNNIMESNVSVISSEDKERLQKYDNDLTITKDNEVILKINNKNFNEMVNELGKLKKPALDDKDRSDLIVNVIKLAKKNSDAFFENLKNLEMHDVAIL